MIPTTSILASNIPIATTACRELVKTEGLLLDAYEAVSNLLDLRTVLHDDAATARSGSAR